MGGLSITKVSAGNSTDSLLIRMYRKGALAYEKLMSALRAWVENIQISLEENTADDFVLPLSMDEITGEPTPLGGALHSQVAVLSRRA